MIDKSLVEAIAALAVKAHQPDIVPHPQDDARTYFRRLADGTLEEKRLGPSPRGHVAGNLDAVIAWSKMCSGEQGALGHVWVHRTGVELVCNDDGDRRDRVKLPLSFSPQLQFFSNLERDGGARKFTQAELILTLRTLLKECLGPAGGIIEVLRQVDFKVANDAASSVQHGKSSVGKITRTEVSGARAIPEYVTFSVPIFATGFKQAYPIECAIEPDPATATFRLIPIAGCIEDAVSFAEHEISERIIAGGVDRDSVSIGTVEPA